MTYTDRKYLMKNDMEYYNAMLEVLKDEIRKFVEDTIDYIGYLDEDYGCENLETLDDLLNCGFYGNDYENSRKEFINRFAKRRIG